MSVETAGPQHLSKPFWQIYFQGTCSVTLKGDLQLYLWLLSQRQCRDHKGGFLTLKIGLDCQLWLIISFLLCGFQEENQKEKAMMEKAVGGLNLGSTRMGKRSGGRKPVATCNLNHASSWDPGPLLSFSLFPSRRFFSFSSFWLKFICVPDTWWTLKYLFSEWRNAGRRARNMDQLCCVACRLSKESGCVNRIWPRSYPLATKQPNTALNRSYRWTTDRWIASYYRKCVA